MKIVWKIVPIGIIIYFIVLMGSPKVWQHALIVFPLAFFCSALSVVGIYCALLEFFRFLRDQLFRRNWRIVKTTAGEYTQRTNDKGETEFAVMATVELDGQETKVVSDRWRSGTAPGTMAAIHCTVYLNPQTGQMSLEQNTPWYMTVIVLPMLLVLAVALDIIFFKTFIFALHATGADGFSWGRVLMSLFSGGHVR